MRRDTENFSMYSLMSTRMSAAGSAKRNLANARATSVLPTPVGPENMNEPIGRFGSLRPARLRRIERDSALIASSCATTDTCISSSMRSSLAVSASWRRITGMPVQRLTMKETSSSPSTGRCDCRCFSHSSCLRRSSPCSSRSLRDRERELQGEIRRKQEEWEKHRQSHRPVLGEEEVSFIVSRWTGIPVMRLQEAETARLLRMEEELHVSVVAQEEAIKALSRSIRRSRAGLKDPNRPIGSFIFSGPTGVGKTEVARALAKFLFADPAALIRVDMSEYMEKFSVSRLIGAPPGYVGYEDSGTLTKAVRRKPYSVVLLDEIEKAHPDVFNILLQVLDEGHLTDNYGRVIDFKNTVVIMTSNVGARDITKGRGLGFHAPDAKSNFERIEEKVKEELQHVFNPEFLNRLDDTIVFHPLSQENIGEIVGIVLKDVQKRLIDEELTLKLTDTASAFLVKHGYDEKFGARPLKRAIQKFIEDPLSEKILLAELDKGDAIEGDLAADGLKLDFRVLSGSPKA